MAETKRVEDPNQMRKEVVSVGKHSMIYVIGQGLSRAVGFFMIPVYTKFIAPSNNWFLGVLTIFLPVMLIMMVLLGSFYPAVDIVSKDDTISLNVELPGVNKEDISVNIEDKILTIKGERKFENEEKKGTYYRRERAYGSFKRSFNLSDEIMTDEVSADYKDGVLTVTLKKDTAKEAVKQITVN